jgi:hypothetical protein
MPGKTPALAQDNHMVFIGDMALVDDRCPNIWNFML